MDSTIKNTSDMTLLFAEEYSTELPAPDVNSPVVTIVLISVAVVCTIGLLFGLAVFIDCRHQKLLGNGKRDQERKMFNISLPKFLKFRRFSNEEDDSFADKMYGDPVVA